MGSSMRGVKIPASSSRRLHNGNLRAYANLAWAIQRGDNSSRNQYLLGADEFAYTRTIGSTPTTSQVWTGSGGMSYLWYGTRFTADLIYGSGLRPASPIPTTLLPMRRSMPGSRMNSTFPVGTRSPCASTSSMSSIPATSSKTAAASACSLTQYGPRRGLLFRRGAEVWAGRQQAAAAPPAYVPVYLPGYAPLLISKDVDAVWTWTGFYLGGNVGRSTGKFNSDTALQRQFRQSAVCNQLLAQALRRRRRRPDRLQLAGGHGRGRPRKRRGVWSPAHHRRPQPARERSAIRPSP